MSRDVSPLPWSDLHRLWFVAAVFTGAIAASAVVGIVGAITRSWPETFTTDPKDTTP